MTAAMLGHHADADGSQARVLQLVRACAVHAAGAFQFRGKRVMTAAIQQMLASQGLDKAQTVHSLTSLSCHVPAVLLCLPNVCGSAL